MRTFINSVAMLVTAISTASAGDALTLRDALNLARANNRELQIAQDSVRETEALQKQAGLLQNPEMEFSMTFDQPFNDEGEGVFRAGISQPFSPARRISRRSAVAGIDSAIARAEASQKETEIGRDVRRLFVRILSLDAEIALQESLQQTDENLLDVIKSARASGQMSVLDENTAGIALQRTLIQLTELQNESKRLGVEFNRLLGRKYDDAVILSGELLPPQAPESSAYAMDQALARRGDYNAALLAVKKAEAEERLARAERFDDWKLGLEYEREQTVVDGASRPQPDEFVGVSIGIPLPLFNRQQGLIQALRVRRESVEKKVEAIRAAVEAELFDAMNRATTFSELIKSYDNGGLERVEKNTRLAEQGYRNGLVDMPAVVQARQQRIEVQSEYLAALLEFHLARADLDAAAGLIPEYESAASSSIKE